MAGPSIGTWVKVKNKSGRMTSRVIPNKFGGGNYSQGEVITQSEFKKVQEQRAEAKSGGAARAVDVEVVTDPPRKRSRWNQLIDSMESTNAKEKELSDRALGVTARVAKIYVKTLADAGVTPSSTVNPKPKPALPGTSKPRAGRLGRLIDDIESTTRLENRADARLLGTTAKMIDTVEKLESRRGKGRKAIAGKKKPKQKRLKADG